MSTESARTKLELLAAEAKVTALDWDKFWPGDLTQRLNRMEQLINDIRHEAPSSKL